MGCSTFSRLKVKDAPETSKTFILLLGTGNSGKSTILKQMRLLYGEQFSITERKNFYWNMLDNIMSLIDQLLNNINQDNPLRLIEARLKLEEARGSLKTIGNPPLIFRKLQEICLLEIVQRNLHTLSAVGESGSLSYFIKNMSRFSTEDYLPSDQDILYCRLPTTGINTTNFVYEHRLICMVDVGGQRSERRKWIHVLDNADILLFCTSLSAYNIQLEEDSNVNAIHESLVVFKSIINMTWFRYKKVLLFLNKIDLFEQKIPHYPLKDYFPTYNGDLKDFDAGISYLRNLFLQQNKYHVRPVFVHVTCATDTYNIKSVFQVAAHTIFQKNIQTFGIE